jgi:hypothetical protein
MNVSSSTSVQQALRAYQSAETEQPNAQIAVLKKALDAQKGEAAQLLKVLQGKGQIIDLQA